MKSKKTILVVLGFGILGVIAVLIFLRPKPSPDVPLRFWAVSFSADGNFLATVGGQDNPNEEPRLGELIFWDCRSGKRKAIFRQPSTIRTVAWSSDGKFAAFGAFDGTSRVVQPLTCKTIANLPPHPGGFGGVVNAVSISADNKLVAAAGTDGAVTLWQMGGKEADPLILPPGEKAFNVAVSGDGGIAAVAGRLGKAYLYDINQRGEPRTLQCYDGPARPEVRVEAIALTCDGALTATGCEKTLRIWDTASGRLARDLRGATSRINSLAFSPDGKVLASVDNEGSLTLWDSSTGALTRSVPAHVSESFSVAYSRDGTRIATAGRKDYTAKIWDANTLVLKQTLVRATAPQLQKQN